MLQLMRWPDENRDPSELAPPEVEVSQEEIDGALALTDTTAREDLEGDEFRDTHTEALARVIEAKREHREPAEAPEPEAKPAEVQDLMAALNESVARACHLILTGGSLPVGGTRGCCRAGARRCRLEGTSRLQETCGVRTGQKPRGSTRRDF
ncbi:Ku family protein [Streptomyces sennicomposti]